ncbi:MAG: hypothetical protein F6K40_39365 [Okeania sp. SIO3I5]|uniref:hypothetical protein n=1 Tax=Okeania sp. SIO3I5 TaxID=2607805 RepID=UPI0013B62A6B|nr:hypothetical protein [Okeania sp. SIO3I5]NEQ41919.1 hypothetical protein [Okeania sp. SIO3I5]
MEIEEVKNLSADLFKQMFLHLWKEKGCPLKNEDFFSESSLENIADIANVAAMHFSIEWNVFLERVNELTG